MQGKKKLDQHLNFIVGINLPHFPLRTYFSKKDNYIFVCNLYHVCNFRLKPVFLIGNVYNAWNISFVKYIDPIYICNRSS